MLFSEAHQTRLAELIKDAHDCNSECYVCARTRLCIFTAATLRFLVVLQTAYATNGAPDSRDRRAHSCRALAILLAPQ